MVTWGVAIDNSASTVWFTEQISNSVWSFNTKDHEFMKYKLKTSGAFPFGITVDSNQNIWFTELEGNKIGEIAANGSLTELSIPVGGETAPSGITVSNSGVVWFTLPTVNSIGSFKNGEFEIYNLTSDITEPVGIAVDQGGNVWFTQHGASFISEFDPTTHYLRTISSSNNSLTISLPYFCYLDSAGNIWFNEHQGNAEAEFTPSSNTLVEYFIPSTIPAGNISYMLTSAVSHTGQPWYTELETGKVGTVNITKSTGLSLNLTNYSGPLTLVAGGTSNLSLKVGGSSSVSLRAYVGNFTGNFSFTFSPDVVQGGRNSILQIAVHNSPPGAYFVTITSKTGSVAVSKIIEIKVI